MSYKVTLTPEAKHDLREIYRYPERFWVVDPEPWRSRNLQVMPVDNCLMFYIPDHQVKP